MTERIRRALVTGGGGFLGGAIVDLLRQRGTRVRSFSRRSYPQLLARGVEEHLGDLADAGAVLEAARDCDIVFHVAAKAGVWGAYEEYHRANVVGTSNVLNACRLLDIPRLVYTSSPSVVFDGRDMEGVDETVPYPERFKAAYPKTKMLAEKLVREANDAALATVSLRPHLIWGPGDNHLVPRIVARGRAGALRRIGREPKLVDSVYIEDAARAHLAAADRLVPGATIGGRVYFITQGEPLPVWELVNKILAAAEVPPVTRTISPRLAYCAGAVLETLYRVTGRQSEPRMTRFLAEELSHAHWFDISAAKRDLGWEPARSIDEGMKLLRESLREEAAIEAQKTKPT